MKCAGDRSEGLNKARGGILFAATVTALAPKTLETDRGLVLDRRENKYADLSACSLGYASGRTRTKHADLSAKTL